jgi:hypothetical protein
MNKMPNTWGSVLSIVTGPIRRSLKVVETQLIEAFASANLHEFYERETHSALMSW